MGGVSQRVILAVITAFIPIILSAQTSAPASQTLRDRDPDLAGAKKLAGELQDANFHSGSFYLFSRLRIAEAGYTETAFVPTGEQSGGLSLRVEAPQRLYYVPHKKTIFTAEVVPGYNLFTRDDQDRRVDYLVRGDAHFLLNHLYLDVYTQRADQLRAQIEVNDLARMREEETGAAGEFKYSSRTSVQFAARYRQQQFPDEAVIDGQELELSLLDRDERNGRVSFMHRTFPMTALYAAAEASDYEFERARTRDGSRRYAGAGLQFDSGRTQIQLEAGPARLDFDDPAQVDFEGPLGNARVARSNGRWRYHAAAARDLGFSIYTNNNYYISDSGTAGVTYAATRRLELRTGVVGERHTYDVPVGDLMRRDHISFSSVGFTYGIRRFRFGADAGWYQRSSTAPGEDDSGIRYVLNLSFVP